jgi:hypothetical protein
MKKQRLWLSLPVAGSLAAIAMLAFPVLAVSAAPTTSPHRSAAVSVPSIPVAVTNGSANPVPTQAQGTTNIAGTVGATQNGTWNVNVGSLPPVTGSVSVSNSPDQPLSVLGAAPAQTLWAFKDFADNESTSPNDANVAVFTVPAGKIAVIETVSAAITSDNPNQIPELQVYAFDGTTTYGGAWIALQNEGTSSDPSVDQSVAVLVGTQNVRLYVPAGVTVYADAQIPAGQALGFGGDIQLTGYYLDAS